MFVADENKTRFDLYFARNLAEALTVAQNTADPIRFLAARWHLDETPSPAATVPVED